MPATRREHAPRRGRFSAQRSGSPETTGSIGTDERTTDGFMPTRVQTTVHDEGSRRGFTRRFATRVHCGDSVRAERAGRLGATSELRDSGSLKTASERVLRRRPGFVSGVRPTPVPNRLGADASDQPCRRRGREHAPRRGRFSAQRSGSPETTGSIGTDERTTIDGGSRRAFGRVQMPGSHLAFTGLRRERAGN